MTQGKCKLCGSQGTLRDSHILPEFVYRPSYDSNHTAVLLDIERQKRGKTQKGFTERLLCAGCESLFSGWETYFAKVWFHSTKRLRPASLSADLVTIRGLDYVRFKLFHLSLIWRAGVSTRNEFKNVKLGAQEAKLRIRLLAQEPGGPDDYPFFGLALRDPTTGGFQDKILKAPDATRINGHRVYTLVFGGVLWHYWVSGHTVGRIVPAKFSPSGELILAVQNWMENVFVRDMASKLGPKMRKPP